MTGSSDARRGHRGLPAPPDLLSFIEVDVRTYVTADGAAGVFFFSLDADSTLGAGIGRLWYMLPYFFASASADVRGGVVRFASRRQRGVPDARFAAECGAAPGPARRASPGLESWLTERDCLYATDERGRLHRAEIHHAPWMLRAAEVTIQRHSLAAAAGIEVEGDPALAHVAEPLDVALWAAEPVEPARRPGRRRAR